MADTGKLILRLTVGILLLFHGINKLRHGIGFITGVVQAHHLPSWVAYGVHAGEVIAPIFLIIGLLTRPAAIVVMIDMAMAIYLALGPNAFALAKQTGAPGGETAFLYFFGALTIVFLGSGRFAVSKGRGRWD